MSVYVDLLADYGWKLRGRLVLNCHMFTDGEIQELHDMAARIGMKREWFQNKWVPHYDLTPSRRAAALRLGAREISRRGAFELWRLHARKVSDESTQTEPGKVSPASAR